MGDFCPPSPPPSVPRYLWHMLHRTLLACALAALAGLSAASAPATLAPMLAPVATSAAAASDYSGDPFPLDTCPVSGEKLGKDAVTVVLEGMKDTKLNGTQVKFCCPKCVEGFKADPAKYTGKMNEAIVKAAGEYPIKACIVMTDEVIDSDAKIVVHHNRVYRLCCKKCVTRFERDPSKYVQEFEARVIAAQKPAYKATTCPVSGKPLGDGAVDMVLKDRLVRVCCPGCVGPVKADPAAAFAKIDAAK
jgi:YHS domain-containing protein